MFDEIITFIKNLFGNKEFIPLHAPVFFGNEKKYLEDCIDSTYVSYLGQYVNRFEEMICNYTGAQYAVATVNGTTALQVALQLAGVKQNDEVLTQALTFVATANAIHFCNANPVFIDSDPKTLGMSVEKLEEFLTKNTRIDDNGQCINIITKKKISACVPVHIFGHLKDILQIINICQKFNIPVVEDAAESLGSFLNNKHSGTFGTMGILSFNGNKTVTTGGGGMIITNNAELAKRAKHLTSTAKVQHPWNFYHDDWGYNYRMPNINAAVGCAQMEMLPQFIENKRELAQLYANFFINTNIHFFVEPDGCKSNYWLNLILLSNREERDQFLEFSNKNGVMTRPFWTILNKLPMYKNCQSTNLDNAQWLEDRGVNIPSSVRILK